MFVGSPIKHSEEELLAIGKKLKRNSIAINIISYGATDQNNDKLEKFINSVNNNNNSNMLSVQPGCVIVDALFSSSLMGAEQPDQIMTDNVSGGNQQSGNVVPQSQFDRDMQRAFELSNEEEKKRHDTNTKKDNKDDSDKTGPQHDKIMTEKQDAPEDEEMTEEQLLKLAMDMSKVEQKKQEDDDKKKKGILIN